MFHVIKQRRGVRTQIDCYEESRSHFYVMSSSAVLLLTRFLVIPVFLSISSIPTHAEEVMGICTWTKGNLRTRKQSCTMQHLNSGSLTITTHRRNYVFKPNSSRGGYKYDNRIFQLHGDLNADSNNKTSFSLISTEANKPFRKLVFESENP